MIKKFLSPMLAIALVALLGFTTLADTIRLKDGSVIRGQVIGFGNQQFTVLVGSGSRGRRSRITIYMEDVESIEFDSATNANNNSNNSNTDDYTASNNNNQNNNPRPQPRPTPANNNNDDNYPSDNNGNNNQTGNQSGRNNSGSPTFFQIRSTVRADNTANGWTNTGLVVRRGQRLRINATGRVNLGAGRFATPGGLPTVPDRDKLMRNDPTGGLIAVIGDDNDDFIFIGARREFVATRDGVLFLGVNEGNLADNSGTYEVTVEAEAK